MPTHEEMMAAARAALQALDPPVTDEYLVQRFVAVYDALEELARPELPEPPPAKLVLPYSGQFYGNHSVYCSPNNRTLTKKNTGWFFYAPRTGPVDRFRWNRRTDPAYSKGDGGTYTCQIWPANAATKLPIRTGKPLARLLNYKPRNDKSESDPPTVGGSPEWPVMAFTEVNAPLVKGEPYCFEWSPTPPDVNNCVSMNGLVVHSFMNETGPNSYPEAHAPTWIKLPGTDTPEFPYPVVYVADAISWRKGFGDPSISLRYGDGTWFGNPSVAPGDVTRYALIGDLSEARDLRRVTLADRTVDGVWIRIVRFNGADGDLHVILADHGEADSDFRSDNGDLLVERIVAAGALTEVKGKDPQGQPENFNETTGQAPFDFPVWHFVPFEQQLTLEVGRSYSLRFRKPSGLGDYGWRTPQGCEHGNAEWSPVADSWAEHEANHQVPWQDMDSRGVQVSIDEGNSWSWYGDQLRCRGPVLYRCVTEGQ